MALESEHLVLWKLSQMRRTRYECPGKFCNTTFLTVTVGYYWFIQKAQVLLPLCVMIPSLRVHLVMSCAPEVGADKQASWWFPLNTLSIFPASASKQMKTCKVEKGLWGWTLSAGARGKVLPWEYTFISKSNHLEWNSASEVLSPVSWVVPTPWFIHPKED